MAAGMQERETIKTAFARYVSQHVLESILSSHELPKLQGERRHITVLFSDIRGFTTLAENMRAEDALAMLNEYFGLMIDIVHRHGGTLDKMMGDGIMAIFGAPLPDSHQEEHAIRAAIEMLQTLDRLRENWEQCRNQPLQIGIGINSGVAVIGNVGSLARMEYTAIGDTVNLAARLEAATKEFGAPICMSESTYSALRGVVKARSLGKFKVRGRADDVTVYTLDGELDSRAAGTPAAYSGN
jgi:adenylate cyclase